MRITSLPRYYRNIRRWREIIAILRHYGLADWLSRLPLEVVRDWIKDDQVCRYRVTRERLAFEWH